MAQLGHTDQESNPILYTHTFYHASGIERQLSYVTQDTYMHTLARWSGLDAQR